MKLIIKDYLNTLNEEVDLNELIPKLYLLNGYTIVYVAQKGVRQHGVDFLAEKNGCPHLITIKQGNINRIMWDSNPNSLRQSLNEIIDAYIPNNLSRKYNNKKIHIDIVYNGYVEQSVQDDLNGYEKNNKKYVFNHVNIDKLTELVYNLLLNENLFSVKEASILRKCLVLINEKDFNINIYNELFDILINSLLSNKSAKKIERDIRKIILIHNIICSWNNDSNVFVNKIKCCESLILKITTKLLSLNKNKKLFEYLFNSITDSYVNILSKYFNNANQLKGTYRALPVFDDFAHRVKLYEILGLVSIYGLMLIYKNNSENQNIATINNVILLINDLLTNYDGFLYIPLESNCMEVTLALLFMYKTHNTDFARNYAIQLLNTQLVNYIKFKNFPFPYDDYYKAISNKEKKNVKFESSLVIENLYEWLIVLEAESVLDKETIQFCNKTFKDVSLQTWTYDKNDELKFYEGNRLTGESYVFPELKSYSQYKTVLKKLIKQIDYKSYVAEKRKIPFVSMIASRLYRMPVNPYLYLKDLK